MPKRICTDRDEPIVAAIEAIYEAALDPANLPDALQAIADCTGDVGAILLWRREDQTFGSIASPSVIEAQKEFEQGGWMVRDLRALRAAERGYFLSGEPFTDRHLCSEEEIRTDPCYTDFQAHFGLGWFGAVAVSPHPHVGVVLSIHRAKTRPAFSEDELALLARIGRHVENCLRIGMRLFDSEALKTGLGEVLAHVDIGVFALSSKGRVVYVNPAGERLLGDGLSLTYDKMLIATPRVGGSLQIAVRKMKCAASRDLLEKQKPVLIKRGADKRPMAIYMLPITGLEHPAAQFLSHAETIVLAVDTDISGQADPAIVRDILGLTLGEARLAVLIGSGLSPREASERLGIAEETARTVLKHVFSKTGVSRQSELVALLGRVMLH